MNILLPIIATLQIADAPPPPPPPPPVLAPVLGAPVLGVSPRSGWLVIPRLGFAQPIAGAFADCAGGARPPAYVTRWTCAPAAGVWLIGHNPGVFAPIVRLRVGDVLYEGLEPYQVVGLVVTGRFAYPPIEGALILQTCLSADSSLVLIIEANPR